MFATALRQLRPPSRLAGRLGLQSLLFALGEGTFMTGSAVFFTQIVGLTAAQVGLGLTLAGVAAFAAAWPMGKAVVHLICSIANDELTSVSGTLAISCL